MNCKAKKMSGFFSVTKNVKLILVCAALSLWMSSCSSGSGSPKDQPETVSTETTGSSSTETAVSSTVSALSGQMTESKGIGPVSSVAINGKVDDATADKGKALFEAKCTACHNPTDQKKVGPGLKNVTHRRQPEWIMNMILNPSEMTQKDPVAKELLGTYLAQMANQSLTQDEARMVLEYLRKNDI